jgi:hypothetical protein
MVDYNRNVPLSLNISIASACEAIEYWLRNVVMQEDVIIESVNFSDKEHFTIKLCRETNEDT